jgi:glutathione synthase/RimK-type ligase-like ATP-grasp enzyme
VTNLFVLDERQVWWQAIIEAGARHGYTGKRIMRGRETQGQSGIGFIRPHADPRRLPFNRTDYVEMAQGLTMIQDVDQVWCYEDKSRQFFQWGRWMPETVVLTHAAKAIDYVRRSAYPLVSKADQGASSVNVRILKDRREAERHVRQAFGPGIVVDCCSGGAKVKQKGYVYLQRFIPHQVTWRVNAIGNGRAIFKRYCYKDRPVAQTGNVEPVMELDDQTESLLEFADSIFAALGTKWCALDILRDGDQWKLLETSLAWPWPSPGRCNDAPIFRTGRKWIEIFDAMFEEIESGTWD